MTPFTTVPPSDWVASNALAFAIRDAYPVSPGHTLVVTRRVVPDWFAATDDERAAVMELVGEVKRRLDRGVPRPDGYNVGFNAGSAAGQTVPHLHVHVIPRYAGDMDDPRGGVRYVIPSRGNYLAADTVRPLSTGGETDPFARHVLPLFATADQVAIVAAFVQESGLHRIRPAVLSALARGARVRLLTGDYLDITQASALEMLLDWQSLGSDGGADERHAEAEAGEEGAPAGTLEARVVEVATLPGARPAFHPKAWRFESDTYGVAFVGSSNLSRSALDTGIEWNLRVDRDRDGAAYARVCEAFDEQWRRARPLDAGWVDAYARRAADRPRSLPPGEVQPEAPSTPPLPHEVQQEALTSLGRSRLEGWRRALVVLATGLGKTWLAAFDWDRLREEMGREPRLLFVAHRRELLLQAASTWRTLLRARGAQARIGWFVGAESDLSADLVFASALRIPGASGGSQGMPGGARSAWCVGGRAANGT